jgi:predicted lipid-binding transport protein (Tim44 family)
MNHLDILLFAAITVFVLVRLWLVLGRRNDDEDERANPFASSPSSQDDEDVLVLPKPKPAETDATVITPAGHAISSLAGVMDQIKTLDPAFDEKTFLQGAKAAFALTVEGFVKGDLTPVARWLAPSVLARFQTAIEARRTAGETLEGHIERIAEADVTTARLEGARALLTVSFTSYQENVVRNAAGHILSGEPGQTEAIHDMWVFARDLSSDDPNWQLVETHA